MKVKTAKTIIVTASVFLYVAIFLSACSVAQAAPTAVQPGNGGTGTTQIPSYGQILVGNGSGTYTPTATSSLGIKGGVSSVFGRTGDVTAQNADYSYGQISGAPGYPFTITGNATSTLTQFNGGLTAFASSTVGDGNNGLTVNGNASTTGYLFLPSIGSNPTPVQLQLGAFNTGFNRGSGDTSGISVVIAGNEKYRLRSTELRITVPIIFGTSGSLGDIGISRLSAGVLAVGTGNAGSLAGALVGASQGLGATTSPSALLSIAGAAGNCTSGSPIPLALFSTTTAANATSTPFLMDCAGNTTIGGSGAGINVGIDAAPVNGQSLSLGVPGGGSNPTLNFTSGAPSIALSGTAYITLNGASNKLGFSPPSTGLSNVFNFIGTANSSSVNQNLLSVTTDVTQTGTAGFVAFRIQPTETTLGSGSHILLAAGTSTNADLLDIFDTGAVGIGSTTFAGQLGIGSYGSTNGSSTIAAGHIQIDGYNDTGSRVCMFVHGTAMVITSGQCNL